MAETLIPRGVLTGHRNWVTAALAFFLFSAMTQRSVDKCIRGALRELESRDRHVKLASLTKQSECR